MAAEHVVGATADVRTVIATVNQATQEVAVRVVDDNRQPVTSAVTLPMSLVKVVGQVVTENDVLEKISGDNLGTTAVVRWVDPANLTRWSPAESGEPPFTSQGWKQVGTAVIS